MRRRRPVEAAPNHDRWLVSYADFMTLLFAFFTTLYAMSTMDKKKADALVGSVRSALAGDNAGASPPPTVSMPGGSVPAQRPAAHDDPPADPLDALEEDAHTIASLPELAGRVRVRRERGGVVMSLSEAGFFESGKAELRPGAQGALELFASKLGSTSADLVVEGHTDNVPVSNSRFHSNWELSTVRATFVVSIFLRQAAFDASRIGAAGYADNRPIADNATKEGRARNRRVDVVLRPALAPRASSSPALAPQASSSPTPPAANLASARTP